MAKQDRKRLYMRRLLEAESIEKRWPSRIIRGSI